MVFSLHIIYPNPISGTKGGTLARIKATSPLEHWHLATVSYWSKIKIIWTVKLANLNRSSACRIFIFRSSDCSLINAQSSSWISRSDKIFEILDSKTLIITYYSIRHRLEFTLCTCMLRYNRIHWQRSCQRNLGKQAWRGCLPEPCSGVHLLPVQVPSCDCSAAPNSRCWWHLLKSHGSPQVQANVQMSVKDRSKSTSWKQSMKPEARKFPPQT